MSSLAREVQALERAITTLTNASTANDPSRWQVARGTLDRQIAAAKHAHARARLDSEPAATARVMSLATALSEHEREASLLVEPPTGFRPVANEDAMLAILTSRSSDGAHDAFAQKEEALKEQLDGLSPADRHELARRLRTHQANDPLAVAFTTRMTHERQQRLLAYLGNAAKRQAMQREQGRLPSSVRKPHHEDSPPAATLSAAPDASLIPELETADGRLRRVLEEAPSTALVPQASTIFATLDGRTRRELARRFENYRPGTGDDVAARFTRLGRPLQLQLLETLRSDGATAGGQGLHVTTVDELVPMRSHATAAARPATVLQPEGTAAITSLRAAEYEFDAGVTELEESARLAGKGIGTNQLLRMEYHWRTGLEHLSYGRARIAASHASDLASIKSQMEETSQALEVYLAASMQSRDADHIAPILDGVLPTHAALRVSLGLDAKAKQTARKREAKSDDHYDGSVIGPALELARAEAAQLYAALAKAPASQESDRPNTVSNGTARMAPHLRYALSMLRKLDAGHRAIHADAIETTSAAIYLVLRWVRGRPGSTTLEDSMAEGIRLIDGARTFVGLPRLDETLEPNLPQGSENEEERKEADSLGAASDHLRDAYDELKGHSLAGLHDFEKAEGIKEVEPPAFWAELGKAILVAAIGHVTGGIGAVVVGNVVKALGKTNASASVIAAMRDVMVDSTQGIAGKIADDAFKGSDQEAARRRMFAAFVRGLTLHAEHSARTAKANIIEIVRAQRVTITELVSMREAVDASLEDANLIVLQNAARGWATALAQTHLSAALIPGKAGMPAESTTKMDEYFGSMEHVHPNYAWVERKDSKWGKVEGVLRITVKIEDDEDSAAPRIRVHSVDALGLNTDLCLAMIMDGKNDFQQLKQLAAVKEISVWRGIRNGRLAVDERGTVRDVFGWDALRRWTATTSERAPAPRFYEEPASFWSVLGEMKLSAGAIK